MLVTETKALHKHATAFPSTINHLDTFSPQFYLFSISPRTTFVQRMKSFHIFDSFSSTSYHRQQTDATGYVVSSVGDREKQVHYRCRREGFGVSGDESSVQSVVQISFSESARLLNAMSLAIHLASGRPNTWPLVPTAAVHSLPVLLAPATSTNNYSIVIIAVYLFTTKLEQHRQCSASDDKQGTLHDSAN